MSRKVPSYVRGTGAFCSLIFFFISMPLLAGQYIKISSVDAVTAYPKVKVSAQVNGFNARDLSVINSQHFSIYEDGLPVKNSAQMIRDAGEENFLYLVLSIDSSRSISNRILEKIKTSAVDIVRNVGPKDKIAVYHFDDEVALLHDFTRDTNHITKSINAIQRHGRKTLLYNSIHDSLLLFEKIDQINKKIIVFTDGKDEGSSITDDDIIQLARSAEIPVYFICFKDSTDIRTMARISKLTGGKLIYGKHHEDISGMYETILSVMRNSYLLSYSTDLKKDEQGHMLEVRFNFGEIRDKDSHRIQMPGMANGKNVFTWNNLPYLIVNILLLIAILVMFLYFTMREKRMVAEIKESCRGTQAVMMADSVEKSYMANTDDEGLQLSNAWLLQKQGNEVGKKFTIKTREVFLGQAPDNTIAINDGIVSSRHAKIIHRQGTYYLLDLISDRGTYLNGKKLLRPKALHDWDEIKIGSTVFIFRGSRVRI